MALYLVAYQHTRPTPGTTGRYASSQNNCTLWINLSKKDEMNFLRFQLPTGAGLAGKVYRGSIPTLLGGKQRHTPHTLVCQTCDDLCTRGSAESETDLESDETIFVIRVAGYLWN
jgi:hypothetical protein